MLRSAGVHPPTRFIVEVILRLHANFTKKCTTSGREFQTAPWIVPFDARTSQKVIGRSMELQELAEIMAEGSEHSHTVAVVNGEHGSGKSVLVLEYCREHRGKYPAGIFWVVSINKYRLWAEYRRLHTALGLDKNVQTDQEAINAIKGYCGEDCCWWVE